MQPLDSGHLFRVRRKFRADYDRTCSVAIFLYQSGVRVTEKDTSALLNRQKREGKRKRSSHYCICLILQSSQEKESILSNRRALTPGQKIALIKDNHEFVDIDSSIATVNEWTLLNSPKGVH